MVVNGSSSNWSPVLSGVPQGTVLGPSLFLLFVNDLLSSVSARVKLFADDSVLYCYIESSADHDKLQQDLLQLEEWAARWQMNFVPSKCYIMSIKASAIVIFVLAPLCNTPLGGYVPEIFRGLHHQLPQLDKAAVKVKKEANKVLVVVQKLPKELNVLWRSCQGTGLFVPGRPCMRVRLRRLESIYTKRHYMRRIRSTSCYALCL